MFSDASDRMKYLYDFCFFHNRQGRCTMWHWKLSSILRTLASDCRNYKRMVEVYTSSNLAEKFGRDSKSPICYIVDVDPVTYYKTYQVWNFYYGYLLISILSIKSSNNLTYNKLSIFAYFLFRAFWSKVYLF